MDSTQVASYQAPPAYTPVVQSNVNVDRLPALPVVRKRALPLEEITNNYHQSPKIQTLDSQGRDISASRHILQLRKRSKITTKVASSQSFAWEDLVPYHQYRQKQRRENTTEGEAVWDEEAENAFMDGNLICILSNTFSVLTASQDYEKFHV